jgi:DNA-binding transcriptional regulator YdaS (Cro superfamily)
LGENRTFRVMTLSDYLRQPGVTAVGLAARLGVDHSRVLRWAKGAVPAERVASVSAATGIPAAELRPDLAAAFLPMDAA